MPTYSSMNKDSLKEEYKKLTEAYAEYKARGLSLNMARGKPGSDQVELSNGILDIVTSKTNFKTEDSPDVRNYGGLDGIIEAKRLFAEILEVSPENIFIGGNSSLNLMFDTIGCLMENGAGCGPWNKQGRIKFLCPVPGYDRHFGVTEYYGIEMVNIPMNEYGPDMDMVEELVQNDPAVKGIWCIPKYSNPQGITYSDEVVKRFAALKPAAKDFRIMWDNAYVIHDISDTPDKLLNIFDELKKNGNEDMVFEFASTSKVTFPGAGIAAIAASKNNLDLLNKRYTFQTIGYDKINMLRHTMYFKNLDGVLAHMQKHKNILKPKFDLVIDMLESELKEYGIISYVKPNGGYFVSVNVFEGTAARVVQLCKEAGVILTGAGATYPYGKDPKDSNIRIAPTYPPIDELKTAMEVFCLSAKLAAVEKLIG